MTVIKLAGFLLIALTLVYVVTVFTNTPAPGLFPVVAFGLGALLGR